MLTLLERLPLFDVSKVQTFLTTAQLQVGGARPSAGGAQAAPLVVVSGPHFDTTELLIGLVVLAVLTVAFFFIQRFLTNTLISGNARPPKAALAGWALFTMLFVLAATGIFSVIGTLWTMLPLFGSLLGLNLIVMILFITSFVSAKRSARML